MRAIERCDRLIGNVDLAVDVDAEFGRIVALTRLSYELRGGGTAQIGDRQRVNLRRVPRPRPVACARYRR